MMRDRSIDITVVTPMVYTGIEVRGSSYIEISLETLLLNVVRQTFQRGVPRSREKDQSMREEAAKSPTVLHMPRKTMRLAIRQSPAVELTACKKISRKGYPRVFCASK